mmetsp:Transcript_2736/g.7652  ORF Transcript_2736/g.7652 Transcript_2736/m.7652 type:complete len:285 (+) Transcript_2736:370-1224(+)
MRSIRPCGLGLQCHFTTVQVGANVLPMWKDRTSCRRLSRARLSNLLQMWESWTYCIRLSLEQINALELYHNHGTCGYSKPWKFTLLQQSTGFDNHVLLGTSLPTRLKIPGTRSQHSHSLEAETISTSESYHHLLVSLRLFVNQILAKSSLFLFHANYIGTSTLSIDAVDHNGLTFGFVNRHSILSSLRKIPGTYVPECLFDKLIMFPDQRQSWMLLDIVYFGHHFILKLVEFQQEGINMFQELGRSLRVVRVVKFLLRLLVLIEDGLVKESFASHVGSGQYLIQ